MGTNKKSMVVKVGVGWNRKSKGGKECIKVSINKEIFILYKNSKASKPSDPHYVIIKYVDDK